MKPLARLVVHDNRQAKIEKHFERQNCPEEVGPSGKKCQRPCQKNPNETCAEPSCNCRHPLECQEVQKQKEAAVMARSVLFPHEEKSEPPNKRSKKKDGKNRKTLCCHGAEIKNSGKEGTIAGGYSALASSRTNLFAPKFEVRQGALRLARVR